MCEELSAYRKLTKKHIAVSGLIKMNVKPAFQVLSHSVASAFNLYVGAQRIESNARDTARFKKKMDVLFDTVNSRTLKHHKREFCAILESHARERKCLIMATSWSERMDARAPTEPIDDAAVCANLRKKVKLSMN
ncbi:hypothetical protein AVEN_174203-1 [Araneus ventricosus]|uniref:Transposable element P transposase-like GTP-binding insertion domain-containing protein n=1 Tax=Araneus ventricosus TaxID=182803 RepID=A0A4Y2VKR7_ARAVE|nr:hypothetical protein AVEN_174203-1 [Araneus ventricosus]